MKSLVIAEKPSVGRDIAKVLGCSGKGEGFLFNDNYIVSWAFGHLVELYDPEDYDEDLKRWKRETLPIIPEEIKLKASKDGKKQLNLLKKLMNDKEVDRLICATDAGREGELIFRYIYVFLKCKKPFSRLWISSMTDKAIKDGFDSLKDGSEYDRLYASAKCRSEADWLVGINATRAFTLKYNVLLSIGRVQTPTLAIICERQKEINAFVPDDYFEVTADFGEYKGLWTDLKENSSKIKTEEDAAKIIAETKGKEGAVKSIKKEEKRQAPPLLYDLTELQRDANSKFGFSAQKTLSIAQELYEKRKMITYPRTDSRYLSDDMIPKIHAVLKLLSFTEAYGEWAERVVNLPKLPLSKRIIDNSKITDHHAIIPTDGRLRPETLSEDEFKVFDLIARRFMAVFYPYYVYDTTTIITEVNSHSFVTKGTTVRDPGWTALNIAGKKEKKEELLPNVTEGQPQTAKKVTKKKKQTKPPSPYTEASLLSAMENAGRFVEDEALKEQLKENGLGTPATRAGIIERLIAVKYIVRKGKSLVPTEKGMKLVEVCPKELKSPETTGRWEKGLRSISKGTMETEKFMGSIKRYVNFLAANPFNTNTGVVFAPEPSKAAKKAGLKTFGVCPFCGGPVLENTKAFYCGGWKNGCKFTVWKDELKGYGGEVNGELIKKLLSEGRVKEVSLTLPQTGEKCTADIIINKNIKGLLELKNLKRI
ncbi:MAG: DNA topoisomerase 3 [Clostridiales bacterium]|nr:DNA topoisomerase 3 [Clostridiales bacterium]